MQLAEKENYTQLQTATLNRHKHCQQQKISSFVAIETRNILLWV